jgi:hypothetical protein
VSFNVIYLKKMGLACWLYGGYTPAPKPIPLLHLNEDVAPAQDVPRLLSWGLANLQETHGLVDGK